MKTDALIEHLSQFHPKGYDLSLGRITSLLAILGNPQHCLPPIFHVAGTNGKGSVTANLRAILESGGYSTHVHTSPHLVNLHERYRIAHDKKKPGGTGQIVSDDMLADALGRVAQANDGNKITVFELLSAAMFVLFSEQPADYAIVEVGLGGRFDGTNVIESPLISIVMPISLDHQMHLGNTIEKIAFEKAGIIKPGRPVVIAPQEDAVREVLEAVAGEMKSPVMIAGQDFDFYEEAGRFVYQDEMGLLDLAMPVLLGEHQLANSATAIAAVRMAGCLVNENAVDKAMGEISWPGRFERLGEGAITREFPGNTEIWIDGGHNEAAGEIISSEMKKRNDLTNKNLVIICAMLTSKDPESYFAKFAPLQPRVITVPIFGSDYGIEAKALAQCAKNVGLDARACLNLEKAVQFASAHFADSRILICGSLYLIGEVLKKNGTPPN